LSRRLKPTDGIPWGAWPWDRIPILSRRQTGVESYPTFAAPRNAIECHPWAWAKDWPRPITWNKARLPCPEAWRRAML